MNALLKAFEMLYGFVAKGKVNALVTLGIVVTLAGVSVGLVYLGQQALTSGGSGQDFYKQEPSLRVVDPPVSIEGGTVDVVSVICAYDAIPEVNFVVEWIRLSDGQVEDAIFAQVLVAPLDSDCTPVPVELGIPRGVRPGVWDIRITVDTGSNQRSHNSQPFEVIP